MSAPRTAAGASTSDESWIGGFVGRNDTYTYGHVNINDCVFAPAIATVQGGKTFVRSQQHGDHVTISNCFYTTPPRDVQGKAPHTITGNEGVTVAMAGEPTEYNMSGITAYSGSAGLKYNDIIYGGNITAKGGDSPGGAGIGGGRYNSWGTLNIYGGSINATGGHEAAGIGCGQYFIDDPRTRAKVTINGGTVIAHGDSYAAGIGGGDGIYGADITINGGHVEAYGGVDGAGIGGGEDAPSGPVTINGGYVYAVGDGNAAGIGGGEDGGFLDIIITGGHVQAKGSGIGSGISSGGAGGDDDTIIEISGDAIVEAWAGEDAAEEEGRAFGTDSDDQPYKREDFDDDFPGLPHRARRRLWGGGSKGTIMFRDHAVCVFAGKDKNSATIINEDQRLLACWFNAYARLEPCKHEGHTYTYSGTTAKDTHSMKCKYCRYAPTELHNFEDKVCTVCGVELTFSGETGIEAMSDGTGKMSGDWYDLQGRKLSSKPATKGVFINNGRKTIIE